MVVYPATPEPRTLRQEDGEAEATLGSAVRANCFCCSKQEQHTSDPPFDQVHPPFDLGFLG